jgi:hypothetical protein
VANYSNLEEYNLKLIHLILPVKNHFIDIFSSLRLLYEEKIFIYAGYKSSTALGSFGTLTYFFLLLNFLFNFQSFNKKYLIEINSKIDVFSIFAFFFIIIFGIGGLINIINLNNIYFAEFSSSIFLITLICYICFFEFIFNILSKIKIRAFLLFFLFIFIIIDLNGKNFIFN